LLNETGLRQASAAAQWLKQYPVASVYSSPLKRAVETAAVIARQHGFAVRPLEGLMDIDFGSWQGLSAKEAEKKDGKLFQRWLESPHEVHFPGGESLDDVRSRVLATVDDKVAEHGDETVVLVSHMVVCKVLLCAMLGMDNSGFWQVEQDVCAMNTFEVDGKSVTVGSVNDTCHLKDLAAW